jgi:hypothetical protein
MVKQALKRRKPGFNESYYGFRSFNALLEAARRAAPSRSNAMRSPRLHRPLLAGEVTASSRHATCRIRVVNERWSKITT